MDRPKYYPAVREYYMRLEVTYFQLQELIKYLEAQGIQGEGYTKEEQ
jgi:hypothetical protein